MAKAFAERWGVCCATVLVGAVALTGCNQTVGQSLGPRASAIGAQFSALGDSPPNARAGACYKRVVQPARFQMVTEEVMVDPGGRRQVVVPPVYETVTEQVLIQEAGERLVDVPATYKVENRQVEISPAVERVKVIPAQFREIRETVWVSPDGTHHESAPQVTRYVQKRVQVSGAREVRKPANEVRPGDRVIATEGNTRVVVTQPKFGTRSVAVSGAPSGWRRTTITRRELLRPEETRTEIEPAKFKTVRQQVVDEPAHTKVVQVPAKFETVTRRVEVKAQEIRTVDAPAQFETVTRRKQVGEPGVIWAEILCESANNEAVLRDLQFALFDAGYYAGAVDGTYNVNLDEAVRNYQEDNGLAAGGVTIETLNALGVAY